MSVSEIGDTFIPGLVPLLEIFRGWVGELLQNANPLLSAILVDGVIGGVAAVVGFLPLVMVLYFLIALLEDCGYMARAAVVRDTDTAQSRSVAGDETSPLQHHCRPPVGATCGRPLPIA